MIDWTLDDRIAMLTLANSAARNAIPLAAWRRLAAVIDDVARSDAHVLIVRSGVTGIFSAGADISEFARFAEDADAAATFRTTMRSGIEALAALPIPTIIAFDGGCYGAAVALALAANIRIAGREAHFAVTPAKLGIGYPAEDVSRLIAQIGRGQASRLLFSAQAIDAAEAARIGLVECVVDDAAGEAAALAATIATHPFEAIAQLKATIADPSRASHVTAFDAAFAGAAFARALAAFQSRKKS